MVAAPVLADAPLVGSGMASGALESGAGVAIARDEVPAPEERMEGPGQALGRAAASASEVANKENEPAELAILHDALTTIRVENNDDAFLDYFSPVLSTTDEADDELPLGRGRSPARQRSPRTARRRSREDLTPPTSPTSVLPASASSRKSRSPASVPAGSPIQAVLHMCAPDRLVLPLSPSPSPRRPPGFEASPDIITPPFLPCDPDDRTPPSSPRSAGDHGSTDLQGTSPLAPQFTASQAPLITSPPMSSPPVPPVGRRKTLTGMAMTRTYDFSLIRSSACVKARRNAAPVVKKLSVQDDGIH